MTNTAPIRKSVEVPLSSKEAFTLFTEKMDTWWPLDRKGVSVGMGLPPSKEIRVDAREGGKVVEILDTQEEALWGEILEWSPGERFRMTWQPGRAADMPTEVEVTFTPVGNGCRVELVHSGFEAYAQGGEIKAMYSDGWDELVGTLYASAAGVAVLV
ncbi:MAG: SRPBCC domain-containing protein [Pseudomonadota bacterium]